jgi:hypothetical protein
MKNLEFLLSSTTQELYNITVHEHEKSLEIETRSAPGVPFYIHGPLVEIPENLISANNLSWILFTTHDSTISLAISLYEQKNKVNSIVSSPNQIGKIDINTATHYRLSIRTTQPKGNCLYRLAIGRAEDIQNALLQATRFNGEDQSNKQLIIIETIYCDIENNEQAKDRYLSYLIQNIKLIAHSQAINWIWSIYISSDKTKQISRLAQEIEKHRLKEKIRITVFSHPTEGYNNENETNIDKRLRPNSQPNRREVLFEQFKKEHQLELDSITTYIRIGIDDDDFFCPTHLQNVISLSSYVRDAIIREGYNEACVWFRRIFISYFDYSGAVEVHDVTTTKTLGGNRFSLAIGKLPRHPFSIPEAYNINDKNKELIGRFTFDLTQPTLSYNRHSGNLSSTNKSFIYDKLHQVYQLHNHTELIEFLSCTSEQQRKIWLKKSFNTFNSQYNPLTIDAVHHIHHAFDEENIHISLKYDGIHQIPIENNRTLDVKIVGTDYESSSEHLLIILSGAISERSSKTAPFFSGERLSRELKRPALLIADTNVSYSKDLGLGWYESTKVSPGQIDTIATILNTIKSTTNKKLLLIGGSGAGYAILKILHALKNDADAVIWNPQTDISKYDKIAVQSFISKCLLHESANMELGASPNPENFQTTLKNSSIEKLSCLYKQKHRIIYLQNNTDWHYEKHAKPFIQESKWKRKDDLFISIDERIIFLTNELGIGHSPIPNEILLESVQSLLSTTTTNELLSTLNLINERSGNVFCKESLISEKESIDILQETAKEELSFIITLNSKNQNGMQFACYLVNNNDKIKICWYQSNNKFTFSKYEAANATHLIAFAQDIFGQKTQKTIRLDFN